MTVIKEIERHLDPNGRKRRQFLYQCSCGKAFIALKSSIDSGNTKSCGCLRKREVSKRNYKHGLAYEPLCGVWHAMKDRCYNSKNQWYSNYGGRGITICDEWVDNFKAFYRWAMASGWRKGLEIDRINNDGNYIPSNCRFVTKKANANNRRTNINYKREVCYSDF